MKLEFGLVLAALSVAATVAIYAAPVAAYGVWPSNQSGDVKTSFYDNETVYVASGNITSASQSIRVYIVANNDSWVEGKQLVDVRTTGYKAITTNSSGHIPVTTLWTNATAGSYDIVADANSDGVYNSSYDYVNSSSAVGLTILVAPKPRLKVEAGSKNPSSHSWNLTNDTGHNPMIQLKLTAELEPIRINFVTITASGTGDDKKDIIVAYLIQDVDGSGNQSQGDMIVSYNNYLSDNGYITFEIEDGFVVDMDSSTLMLITYSMSSYGKAGSTYKFDVSSISAVGTATHMAVEVSGLPIGSATKTISGVMDNATNTTTTTTVANATTTTTTAPTTTTTVPANECETDEDCGGFSCRNKQKTTYSCVYDSNRGIKVCAGTIVNVGCCGDADCQEEFYCLDYECVSEAAGPGSWLGGGSMQNLTWTIASVFVVIAIILAVFLILKNRKRKPWRSKREYERDWEILHRKWGRK